MKKVKLLFETPYPIWKNGKQDYIGPGEVEVDESSVNRWLARGAKRVGEEKKEDSKDNSSNTTKKESSLEIDNNVEKVSNFQYKNCKLELNVG